MSSGAFRQRGGSPNADDEDEMSPLNVGSTPVRAGSFSKEPKIQQERQSYNRVVGVFSGLCIFTFVFFAMGGGANSKGEFLLLVVFVREIPCGIGHCRRESLGPVGAWSTASLSSSLCSCSPHNSLRERDRRVSCCGLVSHCDYDKEKALWFRRLHHRTSIHHFTPVDCVRNVERYFELKVRTPCLSQRVNARWLRLPFNVPMATPLTESCKCDATVDVSVTYSLSQPSTQRSCTIRVCLCVVCYAMCVGWDSVLSRLFFVYICRRSKQLSGKQ